MAVQLTPTQPIRISPSRTDWLTIMIQYRGTLTIMNWMSTSFVAFLIGVANNAAGMVCLSWLGKSIQRFASQRNHSFNFLYSLGRCALAVQSDCEHAKFLIQHAHAPLLTLAQNQLLHDAQGTKGAIEWLKENPLRFWRYFCIPFGVSSISIVAGQHEDDFFLVFPRDAAKLITAFAIAIGTVLSWTITRIFTLKGVPEIYQERGSSTSTSVDGLALKVENGIVIYGDTNI